MAANLKKKYQATEQALSSLLKLPTNQTCADCLERGPRWASWSLGVFLCIRCGGIHRKMGTHVSKVKSVTLDRWEEEMVAFMQEWGNERANKYYNPKGIPCPTTSGDEAIENYIRQKYEQKSFMTEPRSQHNTTQQSSYTSSGQGSQAGRAQPALPIMTGPPSAPTQSELAQYSFHLKRLREMGFNDTTQAVAALKATNSDVAAAVDYLCNLPQAAPPSPTTQKVSQLNTMGFTDPGIVRDVLARTNGNIDQAVDYMLDKQIGRKASAAPPPVMSKAPVQGINNDLLNLMDDPEPATSVPTINNNNNYQFGNQAGNMSQQSMGQFGQPLQSFQQPQQQQYQQPQQSYQQPQQTYQQVPQTQQPLQSQQQQSQYQPFSSNLSSTMQPSFNNQTMGGPQNNLFPNSSMQPLQGLQRSSQGTPVLNQGNIAPGSLFANQQSTNQFSAQPQGSTGSFNTMPMLGSSSQQPANIFGTSSTNPTQGMNSFTRPSGQSGFSQMSSGNTLGMSNPMTALSSNASQFSAPLMPSNGSVPTKTVDKNAIMSLYGAPSNQGNQGFFGNAAPMSQQQASNPFNAVGSGNYGFSSNPNALPPSFPSQINTAPPSGWSSNMGGYASPSAQQKAAENPFANLNSRPNVTANNRPNPFM